LIPGRGIFAPTRAINNSDKVKKIFCLSSGIFNELVNAENMIARDWCTIGG
jgi:hypothetical protein